MIRLIISMLILINILQASSEHYYIQLGSFKYLKGLEKSINALPYRLRSHIIVVRSNNWYIPFAYYTTQKNVLYSKVPEYKHYFPDAYINHSSSMLNHPIVHNYTQAEVVAQPRYSPPEELHSYSSYSTPIVTQHYQNVAISEEDNTLNIPISSPSSQPVVSAVETSIPKLLSSDTLFHNSQTLPSTRSTHFTKKMLSGQHYYLAYKSTDESPNLLIKVSFGNHQVTYQPVMGEMQMTKANYLIKDNRLYMFAESFTEGGAFSILDEHREDHFLVSSWVKNKKLNTLRYYYRLNNAKEYLGIAKSKGLASTLEEGTFDDNFLSE